MSPSLTQVERRFIIIINITTIILGRTRPSLIIRSNSGPGAANIICTINPIVTMASLEPRDNNNNSNHRINTTNKALIFIRNNININNSIITNTIINTIRIINIQWTRRSVVIVKV